MTLRLINWGEETQIFLPHTKLSNYYLINPNLGKKYFPGESVSPTVAETDLMLKIKPKNGYRIFVLGGSTAAGYPYHYNGSFSSMLRAILAKAYPDKIIEVVNLSMPAVSSYTVRNIALRLAKYHPDLIIIYSGHNEFYGGLGVASTASLGASRWLINAYLDLYRFRSFQFLRQLVNLIQSALFTSFSEKHNGRGTLMERLAPPEPIAYSDKLVSLATENFINNIADIISYTTSHNIPLFIGTLVSNVHDHPPFLNAFTATETRQQWQPVFQKAQMNVDSGEDSLAILYLQQCMEIDSLPASQYYLLARLQEKFGQYVKSYHAYYKAKDFDGLRFRASEQLNMAIKKLNLPNQVYIVPLKTAFEKFSPHGVPGKELFLEHLHPNLEGYLLMAKQFAAEIIDHGLLGSPSSGFSLHDFSIEETGVTEVDTLVAGFRIRYLMSGWPFKPTPPPSPEMFRPSDGNSLKELAFRFWRNEISWEQLHVRAAKLYEKSDQYSKAEKEYQAIIHALPMNPSANLQLAALMTRQERIAEAVSLLERSITRAGTNYDLLKMLGALYLKVHQPGSAVLYLKQASEIVPDDVSVLINLSIAYWSLNNKGKARSTLEKALKIQPNLPRAEKLAKIMGLK